MSNYYRQCERSNCTKRVDTDYNLFLKASINKTLKQRYCTSCARIIQQDMVRKGWREEMGIG